MAAVTAEPRGTTATASVAEGRDTLADICRVVLARDGRHRPIR